MKKYDHEWYSRFVSDSTYLQRSGQDQDIPEKIKEKVNWFRQQWQAGEAKERVYENIIEESRRISESSDLEDSELIAWAASYEAMALSACNKWEESVWPVLRGLRHAKNSGLRAKLYNMLAVRLFTIDNKDYQAAIHYARKGWDICRNVLNAWANLTTVSEIKLAVAREGLTNMSDAIAEIDSLMGELCSVSGGCENLPQDCINYLHRSLGLLEYREFDNGELFRIRFERTKPQ